MKNRQSTKIKKIKKHHQFYKKKSGEKTVFVLKAEEAALS